MLIYTSDIGSYHVFIFFRCTNMWVSVSRCSRDMLSYMNVTLARTMGIFQLNWRWENLTTYLMFNMQVYR